MAAHAYCWLAMCYDMTEEFQFFWVIIIDAVETKIILVFCEHGINGLFKSDRIIGALVNVFIRSLTVGVLLFRANSLLVCANDLPDRASELGPLSLSRRAIARP
jgi:hypothetical protein